jgi:hypothetical protein
MSLVGSQMELMTLMQTCTLLHVGTPKRYPNNKYKVDKASVAHVV